jgi:sulfoxide reductase heme-binding subunit YedZ
MVDDVLKRRFIQVGLFAWTILLALAVTSPSFIMRAMGGKNWQRLHRLIYVAYIVVIVYHYMLCNKGNDSLVFDTLVLSILLVARVAYTLIKRLKKTATTLESA